MKRRLSYALSPASISEFSYVRILPSRYMLNEPEPQALSPGGLLPNELLIRIFHECVDKDHSPVVISHICRLWRRLALSNSSLWRIIDLDSLEQAKHHLALAQQQPLIVSWLASSPEQDPNDLQWIFSQASRFSQLSLVFCSSATHTIFKQIKHELSQLRALDMTYSSVWHHGIPGYMARLQDLSLTSIRLTTSEFQEFLRNCPLLENMELSDFFFFFKGGDLGTPGLIELPHLKSCTMTSVPAEIQCYIMRLITLPKDCTLENSIKGIDFLVPQLGHDAPAMQHIKALISLQRIHIATISLHPSSIVFTEAPQDSRCTFELVVDTDYPFRGGGPWDGIGSSFSFDSVTHLQLSAELVSPFEWADASDILMEALPHIRQLAIRVNALEELLDNWFGTAILSTPLKLETIILNDMEMDTRSEIGLANVEAVETLFSYIQLENDLNFVLRGCKTNEEGLSMLRSAVRGVLSVGSEII